MNVDQFIAERVAKYTADAEPFLERVAGSNLVIEVRANRMPDGGLVTTFTDITPSVQAAEALERANATLERRVRERTAELTRLNVALERAKAAADEANVSKTRFVAAASHDILQPLNAARLYVTSLIERQSAGEHAAVIENIDASLEAVEEIFSALLDISRLDTGAMKPELADFRIDELLNRLEVEFAPLAGEVVEVNQAIAEDPAVVNADPQGAGWFFKLRLEDIKAMDGLMDEAAYKKLID